MILREIILQTKPVAIAQDHKGTEIKPGKRVAYNRSGDVVTGTIVELKQNEWKVTRSGLEPNKGWALKFKLIIACDNGLTSTVMNPNGFVVIK